MAIQYRIQMTPSPKGSKEQRNAHIRPVTSGVIGTQQVCEEIAYKCTLTKPDIVAVLTALSEVLQSQLSQNHSVHLDGLGTFSLSLKGKVEADKKRKQLRVKNPRVRSVLFKSEGQLVDSFADEDFKEGTYLPNKPIDEAVVQEKLTTYFSQHRSLRYSELRNLLVLNEYDTRNLLKRLVEKGSLKREGRGGATVYLPVPGHFE
ncbi:MAG: HU family DNA-binding protein [Bacteroidaceae bacterium]|nr:HU family DNA-binding protein [Bacteroidaceae bacterium]